MIIPCFRCGKKIDTPNSSNAVYIIAQDTIVREPRETLFAIKHNQATLAKKARMAEVDENGISKYPSLVITDSDYDAVEIPDIDASRAIGEDLVKVVPVMRDEDIQKTGIICRKCRKKTDFVIWGVAKK